jgi:hypothetical protein
MATRQREGLSDTYECYFTGSDVAFRSIISF